MKTAISIPDKLFQAADRYAKSQAVSRSELYARALAFFLQTHRADEITKTLDKVYAREESGVDPVISKLQLTSLPKEEW